MPRKRIARRHIEVQGRYASIDEWSPMLSIGINKPRGSSPFRWPLISLDFKGRLLEPIRGVTDLSGAIFPSNDVEFRPDVEPAVGSIISIRETVQVVATLTEQEFSWLVCMASGNLLGVCYISFTTPIRGRALVRSISFQRNLPPPDDL